MWQKLKIQPELLYNNKNRTKPEIRPKPNAIENNNRRGPSIFKRAHR